ncbi:hypothetical protein D3C76_841990 [compost metagenome]
MFVEGRIQAQRFAVAAVGPQLLAQAPAVIGNQGVGCLENAGGGAVVLLQADHLGIREIGAVLMNILDFRPAPAVNRLVVVAHHHQALAALGQQAQPGVLHGVGVLELVDQQVPESALIVFEQARVITPQVQGAQQQFGEVDDPGTLAGGFIGFIDRTHGCQEQVATGLDVLRA